MSLQNGTEKASETAFYFSRLYDIEKYLLDPPAQLSEQELREIEAGPVERDGELVRHFVARVSESDYPNVADLLETVRQRGLRWPYPAGVPVAEVTPGSRLLFLHERAAILNFSDYGEIVCRTGAHPSGNAFCSSVWWQDIEGGELVEPHSRMVRRQIGKVTYFGMKRPKKARPLYAAGIVLSLPCPVPQAVTW